MRFLRTVGVLVVAGMGLALGASTARPVTIYMALGDSVAAGFGASLPERSYVGRELARLQAVYGPAGVRLSRYATGGATSEGLLRWQAPRAINDLTALREGRRPGLRAGPITVTAGGNDLLGLVGTAMLTGRLPDEALVQGTIARLEQNLDAMLAQLLAAGGPGVTVTVTTYYNPFAMLPPGHPLAGLGRQAVATVNDTIGRVAARYPEQVRVAHVDALVPDDSRVVGYLADQIHPNDRGHAAIAAAVAAAWLAPARSGADDQVLEDSAAP